MKKIIPFVLAAVLAASCDLETSDNGDLDGFWHLVRVDTLATGGSTDLSQELRFWSVQSRLVHVVDNNTTVRGYLFHFERTGDRLRLYDAYTHDRPNGDVKVEDAGLLRPFGINQLEEATFSIESLGGSSMTLGSETLRLSFRKM